MCIRDSLGNHLTKKRFPAIFHLQKFRSMLKLEWFSSRTGTSVEDGISRGIVWTRLPVLFLTSQGWTRVAFVTAFSVFSRRKENGKFPQAFITFFKKKGKNCFPQFLKWYFENLLVVFWKYWPSLLRMSLTNAKVHFIASGERFVFAHKVRLLHRLNCLFL